MLTELMWDECDNVATTPFNHDVFFGVRRAANDVNGTEHLTGVVHDWAFGSRFDNLEASQRLGIA